MRRSPPIAPFVGFGAQPPADQAARDAAYSEKLAEYNNAGKQRQSEPKVAPQSEIDLAPYAEALKGIVSGNQVLCPGPDHSPSDRSLAVRFNDDGSFVVFSFAGDDAIECKDYVRQCLQRPAWRPGSPKSHAPVAKAKREYKLTEDQIQKQQTARAIWCEAIDPRSTLAERYLREHRKLDLPDDLCGSALRFHPQCVWGPASAPALIALFRKIEDNNPRAIHRIGLNSKAEKIERLMLGPVRSAAVKLRPPQDGKLVIAEGIETAMAAMQLGIGPAWALGSVSAIEHFPILPDVQHLILAKEAGEPSAKAVAACSQRYRVAGRRVTIAESDVGSDLNDALITKELIQ